MSTVSRKHGKIMGYDEYLAHQLRHARSRIKWIDLLTGITVIGVGATSFLLAMIVLDQIFVLPNWVRLVLLVTFVLATCAYLAWAVVRPVFRRINLLYAAHTVEKTDPSNKNSLVNWLQIVRHRQEIPKPIMKAIESRAAHDLERIDLHDAIGSKRILWAACVLTGIVILFCTHSLLSTKKLGPSLQRVLFPGAFIPPPTETTLTVTPGPNTPTIPAGGKVTITAHSKGRTPSEVTVYIRSSGGDYWEPIPLDPLSRSYRSWQIDRHDLRKSFEYYLTANDFQTEMFFLQVVDAPMVTDWKIDYHFPAYTGFEDYSEPGGDIDGLEGSEVKITVTTNSTKENPVESGVLQLYIDKHHKLVPMRRVAGSMNQLVAEFLLTADGTYRVDFTNARGRSAMVQPIKSIRVRRDLPPDLTFQEPDATQVEKPINAQVLFRISVLDDYGLGQVLFFLRHESTEKNLIDAKKLFLSGEELVLSRTFVQPVDLGDFELEPGEVLEYWVQAQDNREPAPNLISTRKKETRRIRLVEPIDPKDQQQKDQPDPENGASQEPQPGDQGKGNQSRTDSQSKDSDDNGGLNKEDRQKLEKLKNAIQNRENQGGNEQDQNQQSEPQKTKKNQKSDPKSAEQSENRNQNQTPSEGIADETMPSGQQKKENEPEGDQLASNEQAAGQPKTKKSSEQQGGSQEKDGQARQVGSEPKEDPSTSQKAMPKPEVEQNSGAGKQSEGSEPEKEDNAQAGKAAEQDQGKETGGSQDDVPRPEGEQEPDEQPKNERSHKEGSDSSSSNSSGNEDGSAIQGESNKSGQSSTGSPSEEKGENSNSGGGQQGKGQTETPGQSEKGSQTAGQDAGNEQGGKESGSGEEKKLGSEKNDRSKGNTSPQNKSGDQIKKPSQGSNGAIGKEEGLSNPDRSGNSGEPDSGGRGGIDQRNEGSGPSTPEPGDAPDPKDLREASDLNFSKKLDEVLKDRRIDPNLLEELGMTEQELRSFADRFREHVQQPEKPADPLVGKERQGFGQDGKLLPRVRRTGGKTAEDSDRGLYRDIQVSPPPEVREFFEAYKSSLSRESQK